MKTLVTLSLSLLLAVGVSAEGWLTSWDEAAKQSKATGKPILMDFTGSDWCGWCIKLKSEVFDTKEFKDWANKHVVLLELDYPNSKPQSDKIKKQNADLQAKYGIEGFPTIVFSDAKGKELGRTGYAKGGPSVWTKTAEGFLK